MTFGDGKITGFLYDKKNNKPLAGANVIIHGTQLGAAANKDGQFEIRNVPEGVYTIQVSFIGYKIQLKEEIEVKNQHQLSLFLNLSKNPLN